MVKLVTHYTLDSTLEIIELPATASDKLPDFRLICTLRAPRPAPLEPCELRARSCEREHVCGSKLVAVLNFELSQHRSRLSTGDGVAQAGGQVWELQELERLQLVMRKSGDDVRISGVLGGDDESLQGSNKGEFGKPTRSRKRRLIGETHLSQPREAAGRGEKRLRTDFGGKSIATNRKIREAIAQGGANDGLDDVGEDVTSTDTDLDCTRRARGLRDRVKSRRTI